MQPVQDLTVEDRVSRTQFQYTLEDPNTDELDNYAPKMLAAMQEQPELLDVASDQQDLGLLAKVVFDRETAYRLRISPSSIDQTLYDAFGQRQVSTIFTQLNQYHVVLEVKPGFQKNPTDLRDLYIRSGAAVSGGASGLVTGGTSAAQLFGPSSSLTAANTSLSTTTSASGTAAASSNSVFNSPPASSAAYPTGGQVPLAAFTHVQEMTA